MKHFTVSILGTMPPIRALSSYCYELSHSLTHICAVEFISFKKIYPAFLYPGGTPDDDHTYPDTHNPRLKIRRKLSWYNPLSWIAEGLGASGDLLHAQWWSLPLFPIYWVVCACFKLKQKPVVLTVHNVFSHEKSKMYFILSKILFRWGDYFIVHSDTNKKQLMQFYGIKEHCISVVPHGSLDFHVKSSSDAMGFRNRFGLCPENKVVLLFGAIRPYKGIDIAIKAFAQCLQKIPEARLLIAGKLWMDWSPFQQLIRQLQIEKHVIAYLEYIPSGKVHQFFEVADLCVFPYLHFDSQSGAAAVALSFRKPMIVTDVGGLPDFVCDRRFVVPPGNIQALAQAMALCLGNLDILQKMALDTELVSSAFSWADIAHQTEKIYKKLLQS